jgi:hypothetical protein
MISVFTRAALRPRDEFSTKWRTVVPVAVVIFALLAGCVGNQVQAASPTKKPRTG